MKMAGVRRVAEKCDGGISTVWYRVKTDPEFPRPVKIHGRTLWVEEEVDAYLRRKVAEARGEKVAA